MPRGYLKNASYELSRKVRRGSSFQARRPGCPCCNFRGASIRERELDRAQSLTHEIEEYFTDYEAEPSPCSCMLPGCYFCDHFDFLTSTSNKPGTLAPPPAASPLACVIDLVRQSGSQPVHQLKGALDTLGWRNSVKMRRLSLYIQSFPRHFEVFNSDDGSQIVQLRPDLSRLLGQETFTIPEQAELSAYLLTRNMTTSICLSTRKSEYLLDDEGSDSERSAASTEAEPTPCTSDEQASLRDATKAYLRRLREPIALARKEEWILCDAGRHKVVEIATRSVPESSIPALFSAAQLYQTIEVNGVCGKIIRVDPNFKGQVMLDTRRAGTTLHPHPPLYVFRNPAFDETQQYLCGGKFWLGDRRVYNMDGWRYSPGFFDVRYAIVNRGLPDWARGFTTKGAAKFLPPWQRGLKKPAKCAPV